MKDYNEWMAEVQARYGSAATHFVRWDFLRYGVRIHDIPFDFLTANKVWRQELGAGPGLPFTSPEKCIASFRNYLIGRKAEIEGLITLTERFTSPEEL